MGTPPTVAEVIAKPARRRHGLIKKRLTPVPAFSDGLVRY
jgi:hypothetical protein